MKDLIIGIFILIVSIIVMLMFWKINFILTSFYLIWILASIQYCSNSEKFVFVLSMFVFMIGEIIFATNGLWSYSNPTILGIPSWIPFSWGCISVAIIRIHKGIESLLK